MGQDNQKLEKVMEILSENQNKSIKIRDLSRLTHIPRSTLLRYLTKLKKLKIIDQNNKIITNNYTKFIKSYIIVKKLFTCGLIDYLEERLVPSAIILFGSIRKGEYTKESDVDLFIETSKVESSLDLKKYENRIKHKIQLFIEPEINNLPNELFNNVINGIKLTGYIRIKK